MTDPNIMRHDYRALTDAEKEKIKLIKDSGLWFIQHVDELGDYAVGPDGQTIYIGSRELSLAKTKIEEAVFWAVKHITK